jgi:hypothetical protein
VLGGWSLNQNLGAHSGFPVTIYARAFQSLTGQASLATTVRPNLSFAIIPSDRKTLMCNSMRTCQPYSCP